MRLYVAVTDKDWFALHASKPEVEEVNFWRPVLEASFAKPPWAEGGSSSRKTELGVPLGNLRIVKRPLPYRDDGREWLVILLACCLRPRAESYRIVAYSAIT